MNLETSKFDLILLAFIILVLVFYSCYYLRKHKNRCCQKSAKLFLFFIFFISSLSSVDTAYATNIYVSPESLYFENVIKGSYSEKTLKIISDSDENMGIGISVNGEIKDWVSFSKRDVLNKDSPLDLKVIITPPENVAEGIYEGYIITAFVSSDTSITSSMLVSSRIKTYVEITEKEIKAVEIKDSFIKDIEKGEKFEFSALIENKGNVEANLVTSIDIMDENEKDTLKNIINEGNIMPHSKKEIELSEDLNLAAGDYLANVKFVLDNESVKKESIGFEIVKEGEQLKRGALKEIRSEPVIYKGSPLDISAYFENTGNFIIAAKFIAKIYLDDAFIKTVESGETTIKPKENFEFKSTFTPEEAGIYDIEGVVFYDGIKSNVKMFTVEVKSEAENESVPTQLSMSPFLIMIIIIISSLYIFKIIKSKRIKTSK